VTDLGVCAVGWIEAAAVTDHACEICFEGSKLALAGLDVAQFG